MSLRNSILSAVGAEDKLYVDDVFSTYLYTGNGSTQTINNGIDLAGKGGMVWLKNRTDGSNFLFDTARGINNYLISNLTSAQNNTTSNLTAFNSNGFSISSAGGQNVNISANNYVSWTFRKAPKFFDVVTYTGNGANRTIAHSLGQEVGMILVKRTDSAADWQVYHRSLANTEYMVLNNTATKATDATRWNSTAATTSVFSLGTAATVNASGGSYVAYVFAHDPSADGIIQCGSFTADASGVIPPTALGWEPQFILYKDTNGTNSWRVYDTMRGWVAPPSGYANDAEIYPNTSNAESLNSASVDPTATGLSGNNGFPANRSYVYMAIRRPNKPPTLGTQVYNAIARTGTGAAATVTGVGFPPDLAWHRTRVLSQTSAMDDRLRGAKTPLNITTSAEQINAPSVLSFDMNGVTVGTDTNWNGNGASIISHFFRRAPGFFDVVCYTGTGSATTVAHNLGVAPELMIVKCRSTTGSWIVYTALHGNGMRLNLETTIAVTANSTFNYTDPTSSVFSVAGNLNTSSATYVAYLFATKAGISKVGSYTGNGGTQTINCGFTTGARFILIKRTDSTGDWYVWDSARGIVAGNDPHLSLNTTAAEVTTDDSIDPDSTGFIVNQVGATGINVTAATYIFLAIA